MKYAIKYKHAGRDKEEAVEADNKESATQIFQTNHPRRPGRMVEPPFIVSVDVETPDAGTPNVES